MKLPLLKVLSATLLLSSLSLPAWASPLELPPVRELASEKYTLEQPLLPEFSLQTPPSQALATTKGTFQDPWIFSLVVPGSGQIAMGETWRGLGFLGVTALSVGGIFYFNSNSFGGGGVQSMVNGMLVSLAVGLGCYIWNVVDAYSLNQSLKNKPEAETKAEAEAEWH